MVTYAMIFFRRRSIKRRVMLLAAILAALWMTARVMFPAAPKRPKWADRATTPSQRAEAVKDVFKFAWKGYYENAFPNDELFPVLNTPGNSRNGWGATAIDSLGTAAIMELPDIVDQILEFVPTINFRKTKDPVNLFETTIRYIGGMLSGYDLLTGPMNHLVHKPAAVKSLLTQSKLLADELKFAFDTPTGIPWKTLVINKKETIGNPQNTVGSAGTLIMEWTRLSDLTGEMEYASLVEKTMKPLLNPRPRWTEAYPGIVGTYVDLISGEFTDDWGSWGGGGDSFYEYLIKMYAYDQSRFKVNKDRWLIAAESTMNHMVETPQGSNLTILSMSTGKNMDHESAHLECFAGGNFIFAGSVLNDTQLLDFGLKLTETCHEMYIRTATGIGPEKIKWPPAKLTPKQWKEHNTLGFAITIPIYNLRPETIESFYYAYRATKNRKYQDWAWEAFVAIVTHTRTRNGFAPISNVNKVGGGWKRGRQESFFFSETLKYLYLIFSEEREYQFNYKGHNEWVFSTEGHPFKIVGALI